MAMKTVLLNSYEKRAVEVRTAEIQNQCTILCDQLKTLYTSGEVTSEVLQTELEQMSNIYSGRVMVIDEQFIITEDTYHMDIGKTIVSEDVVRCFRGEGTSRYDAQNRYIEITSPVFDAGGKNVVEVLLVCVSTDSIIDNRTIFKHHGDVSGFVLAAMIFFAGTVLSLMIVHPFKRIANSIESFTEGQDTSFLTETTYSETRRISDAVNKMLSKMKATDDSRNEFVSNVSHELKTPLTSMKVLADSLLMQEEVPAELYKEFMQDMSEEIERENKIINDLLSLVKMDKTANVMNIITADINELVERTLKRLRPIAAERNIELVFESFRPVTAEIDEMKLTLAVTNLVENAIKYNKENGWVHVSLNADHRNFYLEIADSGMGIPKEDQAHIFERFYRVDKSHSREIGGTGLGLAIARSAVVMHRGAIKVFSQPGEGTTFTVRIPTIYVS